MSPHRRERVEEGFALVQVLMVSMLLATASLLVLALLTSEYRQTIAAYHREQALGNAMAGLNGALNQIRNATDPMTAKGVVSLLPCASATHSAVVAGQVGRSAADTWRTTVYYLDTDPAGMSPSQIPSAALSCPLTGVPAYAYLVSTGTSTAGDPGLTGRRTLHATYRFAVTNLSGAGGSMSYQGLCWDVGAVPASGSYVSLQPCLAVGSPRQSWAYRPDLSLQWYGDLDADLCLDYSRSLPSATVRYATLQPCLGEGRLGTAYNPITDQYPLPQQQFQEFASDGAFFDVTATGDRGNDCLTAQDVATSTVATATAGAVVVMAPFAYCTSGPSRFQPSPGVGAGAAAGVYTGLPGPSQELASLAYAARCLDVEGKVPANGLIDYPCKSTPDMTRIDGNQQFQYAGTTGVPGPITSSMAGSYTTVCFDNLGLTVTLVPCVDGKLSQQWQFTGSNGSYADAYTVRNFEGLCLQAGDPAVDRTVVLATCTGGDDQKWNAPIRRDSSRLVDLGES